MVRLPEGTRAIAHMNSLRWDGWGTKVYGDFPQMDDNVLSSFLDHYPKVKFILNTRNAEGWMRSVNAHRDMKVRLIMADLPFLATEEGSQPDELEAWLRGHINRTKSFFNRENQIDRLLYLDIDEELHRVKERLEIPTAGGGEMGGCKTPTSYSAMTGACAA